MNGREKTSPAKPGRKSKKKSRQARQLIPDGRRDLTPPNSDEKTGDGSKGGGSKGGGTLNPEARSANLGSGRPPKRYSYRTWTRARSALTICRGGVLSGKGYGAYPSENTISACENSVNFLRVILEATTPMNDFRSQLSQDDVRSSPKLRRSSSSVSTSAVGGEETLPGGSPNTSKSRGIKRLKSASTIVSRLSGLDKFASHEKHLEREIKAKLEQIEELKGKYTKEQDENKILKQKLDNLANIQSDAGRKLFRTQEVAEKLQIENTKKSDHIEKLERNISHMEDRIRNLEIRASEVERAELTLESTRRNLESCQHEIKMKERELERANEKHEETCKQLDAANVKIKEMGDKMEDLKVQIRHELAKTETIEKGLETIPRLKEEIRDKQEKISSLEKELEEKSALLNASRKSSRDLKEKLRELESRDEKSQELKEELEMVKNEVTTLKRLMASKDVLVQQKCHALDHAKAEVDALFQAAGSYDEQTRLKKVTQVLGRLQQLHIQFVVQDDRDRDKQAQHSGPPQVRSRSLAERESDPSHTPNTHGTSFNKENRENVTHTSGSWLDASKKQQRPKTSMSSVGNGSLVQRSASFHHLNHYGNGSGVPSANRSHSPRVRKSDAAHLHSASSKQRRSVVYSSEKMEKLSSKYRPSLDYPLGLSTDEEMTTESSRGWSGGNSFRGSVVRPKSAYAGLGKGGNSQSSTTGSDTDTNSQECSSPGPGESPAAWRLTKRDKKLLAGLSSAHQDAILSDIIQLGDRISIDVPQKPPRYGRKKPKPVTFTGIVKFKGQLEKSSDDANIYVGVRLDSPIGDSDGVYKGTRYLFTPPEQAKFFKIRDLDSVLDVSSGFYLPATKLLLRHHENSVNPSTPDVPTRNHGGQMVAGQA